MSLPAVTAILYLQSDGIITLLKPLEIAWYNSLVARMVLWKNEKSTHVALLDETEIKLLAFVSKPWIHEGFFNSQRDNFMESSKERNRQSLNFINLKIELLLENTMCSNSKKKT